MSYIKDNFLLETDVAERLYHTYAEEMPIFDYHCHLSEKQILANEPFRDLYEIWLAGDHYKWRLMRHYGIDERLITGDGSHKEKFIAYCTALGTAFGNPLYHWSQLELKTFFGCETEINAENAQSIWDECNRYIVEREITPKKLIEMCNVTDLFTTNEVFDDLSVFGQIAQKGDSFRVSPSFRADKIMNLEAEPYLDYLALLGNIQSLGDLEDKLQERLSAFIGAGCRASDISLPTIYPVGNRVDAEAAFAKRLRGEELDGNDVVAFKGYLTYFLMKLYAERHIVCELHIGAMRNNNTVMMKALGADTGYDSIAEGDTVSELSRLFDALNSENALSKTIVFNLNPRMNEAVMALLGCFQSQEAKGKLQYGAAWWFLDNKVGIERHLQTLTATGHIATFVGMLTDSRSFLSYPRHHYFRRILCNYLANMMVRGEMTQDEALVGSVIRDICYDNAEKYFSR